MLIHFGSSIALPSLKELTLRLHRFDSIPTLLTPSLTYLNLQGGDPEMCGFQSRLSIPQHNGSQQADPPVHPP